MRKESGYVGKAAIFPSALFVWSVALFMNGSPPLFMNVLEYSFKNSKDKLGSRFTHKLWQHLSHLRSRGTSES